MGNGLHEIIWLPSLADGRRRLYGATEVGGSTQTRRGDGPRYHGESFRVIS